MRELELERAAIALFERSLDVAESERDAWLAGETAGRPDLLERVQAMLRADRGASLRTGGAGEALDEEPTPERIGAYRIVERIGRGGMGSVYRGERAAGDFSHVVAIKVVKPGLFSEALVERFRRERQLLAGLSHPNIAQLYDGGETESGSPYFIMECIDGLPLLDWAGRYGPSRRERQRLFGDICAAVAFAHRNLIVHRDLTPSNVLVTADGAVKLIDFGIARPADEPGAAGDRPSASIASLSLTPGYAAPERLTGNAVTTAADIYSLGKLLERLVPPGRGDAELASIIARATATDPADRYPTADALAADVAAWRDGFPVAAMAGGRGYRTRRFIGRHRLGVGAALLVLLLIVGALALTFGAYRSVEAARRAEAARFQDLRSLARYMLFDLNERLARVPGNTAARESLANRAQTYLSALADSPDADAALRHEAAQGLIALANVQGVPAQPNLGQTERARANLHRSIALLRGLDLPPEMRNPDIAMGLIAFAMIQAHTDTEVEKATRTIVEAEQVLDAVSTGARREPWHQARRRLRHAQLELAILGQKHDEMLRVAGLLDSEIEQWPAAMRRSGDAGLDRALATYHRGLRLYFINRPEQALVELRRAEAMFAALDRALPNDPHILYAAMWNAYVGYGSASAIPARAAEMRRFLDLGVATSRRLLAIEADDSALKAFSGNLRQAQAQAASAAGQHAEALAMQREVLGLYRAAVGTERRPGPVNRLLTAEVALANIARLAGDLTSACQSYRNAQNLVRELRRRGRFLEVNEHFVAGIAANEARCSSGAAPGQFTPIE